jgi:hypothetical protein
VVGRTIDQQLGGKVCGPCGVFGDASVFAHVISPGGFDREGADFLANFANGNFFTAFDYGGVEEPVNGNGRVALENCALERNDFACVSHLIARRKWNYLRQNWKTILILVFFQ